MKITNKFGLPDALVRAITNDQYSYTGDISVTQMIAPPRQRWLTKRHWDELEEDVTDRIWLLLGSAVHAILERAEDAQSADLQEIRLEAETNGWLWSGQGDIYEGDTKSLLDYKVTSSWAAIGEAKPEWVSQLNLLAFLYRKAGFEVTSLGIVAIFRDWSKYKMMQSKDYPRKPAQRIEIPMWSDLQCEEYAFKRIATHKGAEDLPDKQLPLCTAEEMWEKPTTYAIMKATNKRATKVTDDEHEAGILLAHYRNKDTKAKYKIVERKGKRTRCDDYCPVSFYCNQYNEYLGVQDETS